MTPAEIRAFNEALEKAALVADPPFVDRDPRKETWRTPRPDIAADIRALKFTEAS